MSGYIHIPTGNLLPTNNILGSDVLQMAYICPEELKTALVQSALFCIAIPTTCPECNCFI